MQSNLSMSGRHIYCISIFAYTKAIQADLQNINKSKLQLFTGK